ncbi:DUF6082 family protein [Streptomyces sp. NPDC007070]|uniref:DUF6082 family protein n=1 Tax=Streptomyces sp. NPDC007070 TaxID=3154312 RepID=UPI0033DE0832
MKTSTTALFALAAVGAAQLVQRERHQRQNNEVALTRIHFDWLTLLTTHPEFAELWTPDGMDVKEYMDLINANQQIVSVSLRNKLGMASKEALRVMADAIMARGHCRRYWDRFGGFREKEATGDKTQQKFNEVMHAAFVARPETDPVGV